LARRGRADHACATFDREGPDGEVFPADLSHRTNLASLHNEFAEVVSTDEAIARLDSSSDKETSSWAMP
jgi:hypothetical protein